MVTKMARKLQAGITFGSRRCTQLGVLAWLIAMLAFPCVSRGDESGIPWSEDLEATLRLARATGKPVLIHFYGDHCPPCKVLEKKAFRDPQLIDAIRTNLLPVKINGERDTKTAARYRITRWPTDVYLYPDGEEIYRNVSAQDPSVDRKSTRLNSSHSSVSRMPSSA